MTPQQSHQRPVTAHVLVASTRAATGQYEDQTGPVLTKFLQQQGHEAKCTVVADGQDLADALEHALANNAAQIVLLTGGTGVSPSDSTVDIVAPHLVKLLPGIAEELRRLGAAHSPHALLSRAIAGITANNVFVFAMPGSRGAVRDAVGILDGVLPHLLDQLAGGNHD